MYNNVQSIARKCQAFLDQYGGQIHQIRQVHVEGVGKIYEEHGTGIIHIEAGKQIRLRLDFANGFNGYYPANLVEQLGQVDDLLFQMTAAIEAIHQALQESLP